MEINKQRDSLLQEREKTHGPFATTARLAQAMKDTYYRNGATDNLKDIHREALDMIATKIARILSGQPNTKDHWDDIAGYAKLGSEACD